jgi:hypothetical protein
VNARWHSIYLYYYDVQKDDLLLDCVRPLFQQLRARGWAEGLYFVRHWHGGSHVRLQIDADPSLFRTRIVPYVQETVERYLQHSPSTATFCEADARALFERRASYAGQRYVALRPNNSLEIAPYEDLAPIVGSQGAAHLLQTYYQQTSECAFTLLEQTRNAYTARLNVCFDQLLALVATSPLLSLERGYMSYRSHAEGFIVGEPEIEAPQVRRQRLAEAYKQRHTAVLQRVRRLLAHLALSPERLPCWLTTLIDIHRHVARQAYEQASAGTLQLKRHEETAEARQRMHLQESDFLSTAFRSPAVLDYLDSPLVIAHRTSLNLLYLHLHSIGLLNEDRYLLDYYIACAIEELLALDPVARMRAS